MALYLEDVIVIKNKGFVFFNTGSASNYILYQRKTESPGASLSHIGVDAVVKTLGPALTLTSSKGTNTYSNTTTFTDGTAPMYLFVNYALDYDVDTSTGYGKRYDAPFIGRIYYAKFWQDNRLVKYFIPVLDAGNRPCMYDIIGKQYYYTVGPSEFKYA